MAKDLVCGMEIKKEEAAGISNYKGEAYYFCSKNCQEKFDQDPEKYTRLKTAPKIETEKAPGEPKLRNLKEPTFP